MLNIENQLVFQLSLGGQDVPVEQLSLTTVQLSENDKMGLPAGVIEFGDPIMWVKQMVTLRKGMKVLVTAGRTMANAKTYMMQLFNWTDVEQQATIVYKLFLILDAEPYISLSHVKNRNLTSNEVLKEIADSANLAYVGTPTQDQQLWVPANKTGFRWALDITSKGYIDPKSCMRVGVTLEGEMRYVNVMDVTPEKARAAPQFLHGADKLLPNSFMVWAKSFGDISGVKNITGGQKSLQQTQNTTITSTTQDKVTLTRKSQYSSVPKSTVDRGRVDVTPIDAGNGHQNMLQAQYQNKRLWDLQCVMIAVCVLDVTDVGLYDLIYVQVIDVHNAEGTPKQNPDQSGVYTVIGKTVFVSPTGQYVEKIVACREGNNSNVDNGDTRK